MSDLIVEALELTYPGAGAVRALRGVDLVARAGELTAVVGPSGSGKSTLLHCIAGTAHPDAGQVRIGDDVLFAPPIAVPPERRRITVVPQEGALFPHLDVAANVGFGLRGASRRDRRARVEELLALVGLDGLGARRAHQLSGGQQQRVALARALAPSPRIVLLDEPFSALDASLRESLREDVAALLRRTGTTAILVTHDQDEALTLADSVAVMRDGAVIQAGAPADVYWRPATRWAARFLGAALVLPGQVEAGWAVCVLGRLPIAPGSSVDAGAADIIVRPTQIVRAGPDGSGCGAVVTDVRFHGGDATIGLRIDGGEHQGGAEVQARWPSVSLPAPGERVRIAVTGPVAALRAGD